jgi:hypothetical protein
MYARPDEFMNIFLGYHETLKTKDLDKHLKKGTLRQDLVKETCKKLDELGSLNINVVNPDLNYDFRYKTNLTGFFDTATHLITSRTNPTENVNMNFIFLNQDTENAEKHAAHLARIHLNCLSYGLELMHQILHKALREFYDDKGFEKFKDYLKYIQFRKITANIAVMYDIAYSRTKVLIGLTYYR